MRALVISDIHANLPALEAVLAAAPQYDAVWNLGDIVGYGQNPNEVVDSTRKLRGIVVRGNHAKACSGIMHFSEFRNLSAPAFAAALWTQGVLTKENARWLAQLRRGPAWPTLRKVQCVHGAPWNEDGYLFFKEGARGAMERSRASIIFCGHTHWQVGWSLFRGALTPLKPEYQSSTSAEQFELPLQKGRRYLLNPGSVGQLATAIGVRHSLYTTILTHGLPGTGCPISVNIIQVLWRTASFLKDDNACGVQLEHTEENRDRATFVG